MGEDSVITPIFPLTAHKIPCYPIRTHIKPDMAPVYPIRGKEQESRHGRVHVHNCR